MTTERKRRFARQLQTAKTYIRNHYAGFKGDKPTPNDVPIMVSQTTNYTCGPASIASAASLYGIQICEKMLEKACDAVPRIGSCHNKLASVAKNFLPVKNHGEHTYKGGLAIANIRNQVSGNGHYILMLGQRGDYLRYFCPRIGQTVITHTKDLDWKNRAGDLKNWTINLFNDRDTFKMNLAVSGQVS